MTLRAGRWVACQPEVATGTANGTVLNLYHVPSPDALLARRFWAALHPRLETLHLDAQYALYCSWLPRPGAGDPPEATR